MSQIFFISILFSLQLAIASYAFADSSADFNEDASRLLLEINQDVNKSDDVVDVESLGLDKVDVKSYDLPKKNFFEPKKSPPIEDPKKFEKQDEKKNNKSLNKNIDELPKGLINEVKEDDDKVDLEKKKSGEKLSENNVEKPVEEDAKMIPTSVDNVKNLEKETSSKIEGKSKEPEADELGTISKIHNFLNRTKNILDGNEDEKNSKSEEESTNKNQKNTQKLTKAEEIQKKKLDKLNKLREIYLIKIDSKKPNQFYNKSDQDFLDDNSRIVPKKREFNKFISYETPAFPILDSYRTRDNFHIPNVVTKIGEIDILFESITKGNDISYFKSAYAKVGNPNIRNRSGDTILTYAMLLQRHSIVASILNAGADPNIPNGLGYTPLGIAIEVGDETSLKLLVNNNANIDYVDAFGRTYLMHACRSGFLPAVDLLVSKGVDINAMDDDGFTALAIAYRHKKDVIVKFLLKHGAQTWIEKPYDSSSQSLIKELDNRWKN